MGLAFVTGRLARSGAGLRYRTVQAEAGIVSRCALLVIVDHWCKI